MSHIILDSPSEYGKGMRVESCFPGLLNGCVAFGGPFSVPFGIQSCADKGTARSVTAEPSQFGLTQHPTVSL